MQKKRTASSCLHLCSASLSRAQPCCWLNRHTALRLLIHPWHSPRVERQDRDRDVTCFYSPDLTLRMHDMDFLSSTGSWEQVRNISPVHLTTASNTQLCSGLCGHYAHLEGNTTIFYTLQHVIWYIASSYVSQRLLCISGYAVSVLIFVLSL